MSRRGYTPPGASSALQGIGTAQPGDIPVGGSDGRYTRFARGAENYILRYTDTTLAAEHPWEWTPPDMGLLAATGDGALYTSGTATVLGAAGLMHTIGVWLPRAKTITGVRMHLTSSAVGLTAGQSKIAIFQGGAGGTLLRESGDLKSTWEAAAGPCDMALASPVAAAAGLITIGLWWNGGTAPSFTRSGSAGSTQNGKLAATASRYGTANSGLTTTAPSTVGTLSAATTAYLAGLY